jgi:acid phosphatase
LAATALGCASAGRPPVAGNSPSSAELARAAPHLDSLGAILWTRHSAEGEATALQAYRAATLALDDALADPTWTAALEQEGDFAGKPPAVILDIDETVLDNSAYQVERMRHGDRYSSPSFLDWCREERAPPIPGALEYTKLAASRGVAVFYVTNRAAEVEDATARNLEALGFPVAGGAILPRISSSSDKADRRRTVAATHRILALVGDDLGDFLSGAKSSLAEREALAEVYADRWGERWFMLPNPLYGSWSDAILGLERARPEHEHLDLRLRALGIDDAK